MFFRSAGEVLVAFLIATICAGCGSKGTYTTEMSGPGATAQTTYLIGPGDSLSVSVWRNPDLTTSVQVRPDGRISTPLVEDMQAVGKSPTQLARDIEVVLSEFVRSPQVTVIVSDFVGTFGEQIRVVGQAAVPQAISYRDRMTLLDVMIQVGGLAPGASGNRAKVIRWANGEQREIRVRINDLINKGDISENLVMMPGDVLIIPESIF